MPELWADPTQRDAAQPNRGDRFFRVRGYWGNRTLIGQGSEIYWVLAMKVSAAHNPRAIQDAGTPGGLATASMRMRGDDSNGTVAVRTLPLALHETHPNWHACHRSVL